MEQMKRIQRILKYEGAIVDMYTDRIQLPDGQIAEWDFVAHRKGAAAVVAVTSEGKLVMVHQYRNALDRETIEIPAGARDSLTEDTKVCALRELEEETGYKAGKIEKLLSLKTTVAFCNEFIDVYLATELSEGERHLDPEEFIDVHTYELEELLDMIYAGTIQDSKTVAGVLAYYGKYGNRIEENE